LAATAAESSGAGGRREKKAKKSKGAESSGDGEKKSKKKLIMLFVVLALVGFEAKGKLMKTHYKPGEKVPSGAIYALGSTTITTNLSDGHLAQVGISLQLTKPANSKLINTDVPELTNSTIKILSGETYSALLGPAGRAALSTALLSAYQQDLGLSEGAQQVTGVYFTTFVLQ
jgi:flagellar FliL protein